MSLFARVSYLYDLMDAAYEQRPTSLADRLFVPRAVSERIESWEGFPNRL